MAKTKLNESVDAFFKKYGAKEITEDIVKSNLDVGGSNEYGSILHAIINYEYPLNAVLSTISILLKLGVNPNYRSKATGMTFIHLAFYGYTDKSGNDHSYSESFITKLIKMSLSYGFDANIKDNDGENIIVSAIASEVYTGSVTNIITLLWKRVKIDSSLKKVFEEYLKEAKSNPPWYKRLMSEKNKLYKLIDMSNYSLEDLEKDLAACKEKLTIMTSNLDYDILTNNYLDISKTIKELISILERRESFEVKDATTKESVESVTSTISNIIEMEVARIKEHPSTKSINIIKPILEEFLLREFLEVVEQIESDYLAYQDSLRDSAKSVNTINKGKNFLLSIKGNELEDELTSIVNEILAELNEVISSLKQAIEDDKRAFTAVKQFTSEEYKEKVFDYDNLTEDELNVKIDEVNETISSYREYILYYLSDKFNEACQTISPFLENASLSEEDVIDCLRKSLNNKNLGVNEDHGRTRE